MITIVDRSCGCGPDFIQVARLPDPALPLPEDGWVLEGKQLKIPFVEQLKLAQAQCLDSVSYFAVRDFPGHMHGLINNRLRQPDYADFSMISQRLKTFATALQQHLVESVEVPLLDIIGYGKGDFAAGDAVLCGILLTARSFSLGRRIRINWFQRLSVETRRFLHRAGQIGKKWLGYALEGRMTQAQQQFFSAMTRDSECVDEIVVKRIIEDDVANGRAFLVGAGFALDLIKPVWQKNSEKKSPGLPANRARR
jgi:hypothetical protein